MYYTQCFQYMFSTDRILWKFFFFSFTVLSVSLHSSFSLYCLYIHFHNLHCINYLSMYTIFTALSVCPNLHSPILLHSLYFHIHHHSLYCPFPHSPHYDFFPRFLTVPHFRHSLYKHPSSFLKIKINNNNKNSREPKPRPSRERLTDPIVV